MCICIHLSFDLHDVAAWITVCFKNLVNSILEYYTKSWLLNTLHYFAFYYLELEI